MVLKRVVVVEVLTFIEVGHCCGVVVGVDNCVIRCVVGVRVAVDGKFSQACKPFRGEFVVGEQAEGCSQNVGFPTVLFSFGVALISGGYRAIELIVTFSLHHGFDVAFLSVGEFVPLEIG